MHDRAVKIHDILRYARGADQFIHDIDGLPNYHQVMSPGELGLAKLMLEGGINRVAKVDHAGIEMQPAISIRSSPWKAGHATNPWHDEFDLDHGHVRYFGDHKVDTIGLPGATAGNRALLAAWQLHSGVTENERLLAPPLVLWRAQPVVREGKSIQKGHVEFCGIGIIERLEYVVQRDPSTGRSFPNISLDIAVIEAEPGDVIDMRWIDDRRDPSLSPAQALRHAPESWRRWVREGRSAIPRVRRRVMSSRVKSADDQTPAPGSPQELVLRQVYEFFDGKKHAFELLASKVAAEVLAESGARYRQGWLTRSGGDGGIDFVGRLDVGGTGADTPLVVLGQAKCVVPRSSISPDQVARVVARLKRGWIGVYVTTGVFSKQAQVEVIDDRYPLVLVPAEKLVQVVIRLAEQSFAGDVEQLLETVEEEYATAVVNRRPDEVVEGLA